MQFKTDALMLSSVDYGENDKILTLFTIDRGKISVSIRGVKKATAKLKFAAQPFCFAEYVLNEKSGRYIVTSSSLIDSFYNLRLDIVKTYAGFAVVEFCNLILMEESSATDLFLLAVNTLKKLCYENMSVRSTLIDFLLKGLEIGGYEIGFKNCLICGNKLSPPVYFNFEMGGATCDNCLRGKRVSDNTYNVIKAIINKNEVTGVEDIDGENRALKLLTYFIYEKIGANLRVITDLVAI